MTAPSVVLLGHGSADAGVAEVSSALRAGLLQVRPELTVQVAFLGEVSPTVSQVAQALVKRKITEIVVVPLLISDAFGAGQIPAVLAGLRAAHPDLQVTASRPIGPEAALLSVLDRRLRDALRAARVSELDGLVFSAAGSTDVRSNSLLARRARQWATHHRLPCVTAFAGGTGPSTAEAIRTLRAQGRRHLAVGSWFLAPGQLYARQLELAEESGAIAVSAPLGAEPEVIQTTLSRYVVAAMDLVDLGLDTLAAEDAPVRHLSVVSA